MLFGFCWACIAHSFSSPLNRVHYVQNMMFRSFFRLIIMLLYAGFRRVYSVYISDKFGFGKSACTYFDGCPQIYIRYYFTATKKSFSFLSYSLPFLVPSILLDRGTMAHWDPEINPQKKRKIARKWCCYAHFQHRKSHKNYSNKFMTMNSITLVATSDIWAFSFSFSYPVPFPIYKYNGRSVI